MLAVSLFLTSLLAGSVFAAPSPLRKRETHVVKVGFNASLIFEPEAIFANVGDLVQFVFQSKNHSVVQSSFAEPCGPVDSGFNSGFQFVANGTAEDQLPVVNFTVSTDQSTPVWFYCSQALHTPNAHCAKGMVFSINCPSSGDKSFSNFKSKAMADAFATETVTATTSATSATNVITPLAPEPTYSGISIPPPEPAVTLTDVITLGSTSTWTTTYVSYPNSPNPTPNSADGSEITIIVGGDGALTFNPMYVEAKPRDTLVFQFQSKNHSVVQSSFAAPCSPFVSGAGVSGVNSGFMPVANSSSFPEFRVKVNDTTPLWFYCAQTGHCGQGMVFAVNSDESGDRNSSAFQTLAKEVNGTAENSSSSGGSDGYGAATHVSVRGIALAGFAAAAAVFVL